MKRLIPFAALVVLTGCGDHAKPGARREPPAITLHSVKFALPDADEPLPAGPNLAAVSANCTACHSAGMILAQPPLKHEQWQATVTKMREAYKAPIPEADDAAIVAYLDHLSQGVAAASETR
jgi:hypothetical protein